MKVVLLAVTVAFVTALFVRIIEMSIDFDWADVMWSVVFLVSSIITGAAYSMHEWED